MNKRTGIISAILAILSVSGCDSESNDFVFSINANPSRTHAPGSITFELVRDDGGDIRKCSGDWKFGDGVTLGGTYEASHLYKTANQYEVAVSLTCDDQSSRATTKVQVFDTVDLAVGALDARPLDVSSNGNMSVSFQIANETDVSLQVPTHIDIYLVPTQSTTAYQEAGAFRIYRYILPTIGSAGTEAGIQQVVLDIPMTDAVSTGKYYVLAVVNPDQTLGELSYDNNAAVSYQSVTVRNQITDGADFEPVSFAVSPETTSILTSMSAQFKFINLGSTTAEVFHYEIWIGAKDNATDMEGAVKIHDATIDGAISGNERSIQDVLVSVTPAITETGLYYFWLILDSASEIVERNESNNTIRSANPVHVTNEVVLDADISVQSVEFTPSKATSGGTITTKLGLINQGSQRTGSFICTIFLSSDMSLDINQDHIVGTINVSDLLANASREVSGITEIDAGVKPGRYWIYAFCDSSGIVSEANEANNIFRSHTQLEVVQTADVDLLFGPIAQESYSAKQDGENLRLSAPLCNQGSTAAGPFKVAVKRTNLCDSTEIPFLQIDVDGIEAGQCQTLYVNEPIYCDFWCPSYQITFIADATDLIVERNKTNNIAQLAETVTLAGDDCVCAADKYETNQSTASSRTLQTADDDLTLCRGDVDVFKPDLAEGQSFLASVQHDSTRSPLKLEMLRGAEVVSTYIGSDHLYIQQMNLADIEESPVYLRISGLNDADANRYHLNLNIFDQTEGIDLAVDQLDIESSALSASEAKIVTTGIHNLGTENAPQFTIGYYISQTSEIDDTAWRIARQTLPGLNAGSSTSQSISLILPSDMPGGAYHLIARVDDDNLLDDARPDNNTIRSSEWVFSRACWDVLDPNDSLDSPYVVTFTDRTFKHDNLTVCQSNPDFYAFDISSGSSLDISVTNKGTGDFDLFLYDMDGNEVTSSRTTASTESIHKDIIMGDQRLILEVRLLDNIYNTHETNYSLSIQTEDAPSWLKCNDAFEPNDFLSLAYNLREAAQSGMESSICPVGDVDYYQVSLSEGERLQLGFITDSVILRAALYSPEYNFISMLTNLKQQTIDYTATTEGTYYLRIFTNAQDASQLNYTLQWLSETGTDVAISNLKVLSHDIYAGQNIALSFDISNKGTETVAGNITIQLVSSNATQQLSHSEYSLDAAASKTIYEKVAIPSTISGQAKIVVHISAQEDINYINNEASATIDIAQSCLNDVLEPNNNILLAANLTNTLSGIICQNDEDWFVVNLDQPATITMDYIYTNGDLVLSLYDDAGNLLSISDTATGTEQVSVADSGTYYIKVQGATSYESNSYIISVNTI